MRMTGRRAEMGGPTRQKAARPTAGCSRCTPHRSVWSYGSSAAFILLAVLATDAFGEPAPQKVKFTDNLNTVPAGAGWSSQNVECEDGLLKLRAADRASVGFVQKAYSGDTEENVTVKATGVDLDATVKDGVRDTSVRSVTIRVKRGETLISGKVRAWKAEPGASSFNLEVLLTRRSEAGGATQKTSGTATVLNGDLVLQVQADTGTITFGSLTASLSGIATGDISLVRFEVQGNPVTEAEPAIDEIEADSN